MRVYHFDHSSVTPEHRWKIMNGNKCAVLEGLRNKCYSIVGVVPSTLCDDDDYIEQNLEWAFHQTNHIESSWNENPNVDCFVERPRSTSVGDVIVYSDEVYMVDKFGFLKLDTISEHEFRIINGEDGIGG